MKPHTVDSERALAQWSLLVAQLEELGVKVDIIEQQPDVPDMVFATDQGIVKDGAILLANFKHNERKKERVYYRDWFLQHGFRLRALTNIFPFEGGDTLFLNKSTLLVGTGFRASVDSCEELAKKLGVSVISLELTDPRFYHLDTCLLVLDETTAFYYPPAFSEKSRGILEKTILNLHELSEPETLGYAANSFVSEQHIVIQSHNPTFAKKLRECDRIVHEVDVSEFNKSGGGIHCLINVLETESV